MSGTSESIWGLSLRLPATPDNIALVRHSLSGIAETLGMSESVVTDLKTVVTEACTNVVLHAYEDGEGQMEVDVSTADGELVVRIQDFGGGIRPRPDMERSSLRLGLALIAALSSGFEISGGIDRGTSVTVRFPLNEPGENGNGAPGKLAAPTDAELTSLDARMLSPVLPRLIRAFGARHDFGLETLSDLVLVADAIADDPLASDESPYRIAIEDGEGDLLLRVGPLATGGAEELRNRLEIPGLGASLAKLTNEVAVEPAPGGGEYLRIAFAATRRSAA